MLRSRLAMIAKDFIIAKLFLAYSVNFFRQDKSLRDHGRPAQAGRRGRAGRAAGETRRASRGGLSVAEFILAA
jgi:hypothetical protein